MFPEKDLEKSHALFNKGTLAIYRAKISMSSVVERIPAVDAALGAGAKEAEVSMSAGWWVIRNVEIWRASWYRWTGSRRFDYGISQIEKWKKSEQQKWINFYSWGGIHHCKFDFVTGNDWLQNQILLYDKLVRDESRWKASTLLWSNTIQKFPMCQGIPAARLWRDVPESLFIREQALCSGVIVKWYSGEMKKAESWSEKLKWTN